MPRVVGCPAVRLYLVGIDRFMVASEKVVLVAGAIMARLWPCECFVEPNNSRSNSCNCGEGP